MLARILHVADAFEAMTAARPYRMTPLTAEQALGELRKFAGVQFDPEVVDAFVRTTWVDDVRTPAAPSAAADPAHLAAREPCRDRVGGRARARRTRAEGYVPALRTVQIRVGRVRAHGLGTGDVHCRAFSA